MSAPSCDRFVWLIDEQSAALRAHVLLGDALRFGETWFEAEDAPLITAKRTLMLRYRSEAGAVIGFCLPPLNSADPKELQRLRHETALAAAVQKWGRFLGLLGFREAAIAERSEQVLRWNGERIGVRRARCVNAALDRLHNRDRDMGVERLERLFARHALAPVTVSARAI